jgi:hypothetical protein
VEGGHRLAAEAEGGRNLGPVELERCASLLRRVRKKLARFFVPKLRRVLRDEPPTRQLIAYHRGEKFARRCKIS